ncbi:hypothetical protein EZV62_015606 [Acer yangbiense]|uniref:Reverse transcriptase Ty1/copia-type domain-containing protein n=1 Tax=Acer yangbiense TaxID=1000413 RepID=A0A5C7HL69_9ROSI|nr:hypothetical protein EZV62_015606 [Acer yangbiense]
MSMLQVFEMTDLGMMKYFLGMEVHQSNDGIFLSQRKYGMDLLRKFKMESCNPVATPLAVNEKLSKADGDAKANVTQFRSLVGSLLYLTATRPDIMFSASLLSRFMHLPSLTHFGVCKRVLRYLKGTIDYGIWYGSGNGKLEGFVDSDWAGSVDDSKSTTGYEFEAMSYDSPNDGSLSQNSMQMSREFGFNSHSRNLSKSSQNGSSISKFSLVIDHQFFFIASKVSYDVTEHVMKRILKESE